jgi:phospholipid/cholesterol/gamma-HCH transport system substrate-binding protein
MAEKLSEIITGGVVLVAAVGFVVYGGQLAGLGAGGATYQMTASFRSVEGVTVGTDVRMSGVKVGTVTELKLNPETFRADARFTLPDGVLLPDDTSVRISSEGLLGGSFVEILPGGSLTNFDPGAEIEDTQGAVSLIELLLKFVSGGGSSGTAPADEGQ